MVFTSKSNATLNLIHNIYLTGLFLILLISLITWLVVRQVVRPVLAAQIATQFMLEIFRGMNVPHGTTYDSGYAFNEMAESLETDCL